MPTWEMKQGDLNVSSGSAGEGGCVLLWFTDLAAQQRATEPGEAVGLGFHTLFWGAEL